MATHIPFRSWCPFCIKGKAGSNHHRKVGSRIGTVPIISMDYAFMGKGKDDQEEMGNPILVWKDRKSKAVGAHMVPKKRNR